MARVKVGDRYGNKREPLLSPLRRVVKEKDEADKAVDFVMPFAKDAPRETEVEPESKPEVAPGSKEERVLQQTIDKEQTVANAEKQTPSEKVQEEETKTADEEEKDDDEFMDDASYENEEEPTAEDVQERIKGNQPGRDPRPEDRGELEKGFGQALAYFGPRLFAQLAGGNDAAAATDKIMKGFEGFQSGQRKLGQTDRELDIKEQEAKRVPAEDQEKSLAERKFEYKKAQDTMKRQEEMAKLDQETKVKQFETKKQLDKYDQALKGLLTKDGKIKGGVTGLFDATIGAGWDKITGGKDRRTRLLLQELKVDSGVARTAELAGQISDKEYASLVDKPAPTEYDSEETWVRWIQDQKAIAAKIDPSAENYLKNVGTSKSSSGGILSKYGLK